MARRGTRWGKCHLCGRECDLTFEHVPPEAAYNNCTFLQADVEGLLRGNNIDYFDNPRGRIKQGGAGAFTLCPECNNNTGSWYGNAYVEFARQCLAASLVDTEGARLGGVFKLRPLRVLKQMMTMFCSACPPEFATRHPEIVRFILNKEQRGIPHGLRIFLSFYNQNKSFAVRQSGITSSADLDTGRIQTFSEICFPPFNIVLSFGNSFADDRFLDITWFDKFDFRESVERYLILSSLPVNSYLPSDYRTRAELEAALGTS